LRKPRGSPVEVPCGLHLPGSAFTVLGTMLEAIIIIATAPMIGAINTVFDIIICIESKYNKIT
jgi:hypothetical protein